MNKYKVLIKIMQIYEKEIEAESPLFAAAEVERVIMTETDWDKLDLKSVSGPVVEVAPGEVIK